ncbi:MAG: SDR family oxidoreductase [Bacteriovoracaceae bacterium]|nr:SDR family oxidoreductase [Bacteroidota bacterium]
MSFIKNSTILITGGASGIGKLMGSMAIDKGCHVLIIWDVNQQLLEQTVAEFSDRLKSVQGYLVDVSNTEQIHTAAQRTIEGNGKVDILINNAGIVVGKYFHEHTHSDIDRTMSINTDAQMHVTLEFLPGMIKRNSGHIVNISSAAGMVGNPKMSVYAASKWAVIGWSDSLRLEMQKLGCDIKVTCVTPYYISTGMFYGVKTSFFVPINKPEAAVQKILTGIEKNALYVRMPLIVYTLQFFKGILPTRWFDIIVGQFLKVYHTMDEFIGRT